MGPNKRVARLLITVDLAGGALAAAAMSLLLKSSPEETATYGRLDQVRRHSPAYVDPMVSRYPSGHAPSAAAPAMAIANAATRLG